MLLSKPVKVLASWPISAVQHPVIHNLSKHALTSQPGNRCGRNGILQVYLTVDNNNSITCFTILRSAWGNTETRCIKGSLDCESTKYIEQDLYVTLRLI